MAEKLLTDRACKAAKPRERVYYRNDGNGLRLLVRPNGAKYWMFRYTHDGRESTFQVGSYPNTTLDEARGKAKDARNLVAKGIHPSVDRRVQRAKNIERSEATFEAVAKEWLQRHKADWSAHHHERNEGILRRILLPTLGGLPIHEITEPVLLKPLRKAYDSGIRESARRARAVAQQVFDYAKDTHRATHNPARELVRSTLLKKPEVKNFTALKPSEVGRLWEALDGSGLESATHAAIALLLYTGLRDFSLRAARWSEIDLQRALWTVPGSRMKSGREHRLPLPKQAVAVLTELARQSRKADDEDGFVFASYGKDGYLAENTLRVALHRLGFKVTAHGFRSLLTDLLNERGFNPDAIERQLDHVQKDKVRAAYLRSDFLDYRSTMMQWVADWADAQKAGRAGPEVPGNVIPMRRVA